MKVEFLSKFTSDLDKIKNPSLKKRVNRVIEEVELAESIFKIRNIKKLASDKISYRIRIGDYRVGIYFENNVVEFARIVHRKDIYKVFP